eukprot:TRINITY_DN10263_c0_g1_i1.p1 TRINITY_DN10263_c0_g1~~TRINITY_DN10263_c0_g1_i1.p1  ORF type:complete len:512 (-),score=108.84 TRINITY_DN10263_c0_g1_i1:68-1579(-)
MLRVHALLSLALALALLGNIIRSGGGVHASPAGYNTTCMIKPGSTDADMQSSLDWVCSNSPVDCSQISPGGAHYEPNTLYDHTAWAVNEYYQMFPTVDTSCDFSGMCYLDCGPRAWPRVRGVNIGSWLLLEPWIVPSMFYQFRNLPHNETAVDEYSFCSILGQQEASRQLQQHWSTWFTEDDVKKIASYGLNTIRIPVGYWIFGDTPPFVDGGKKFLDQALGWAQDAKLHVIIDLHGAPGSQNGFDNSGRTCGDCAGVCPPEPVWSSTPEYVNDTVKVLAKLAETYGDHPAVLAFEVLNEPRWDIDVDMLQSFYRQAYEAMRPHTSKWIMYHDAFRYNIWLDFFTPENGFKNVVLDTHIYQAFSQENIMFQPEQHNELACNYHFMVDWMTCEEIPVVVGEWSLGTSDCPLYLLGFEVPPTAPTFGVQCPHNQTDTFLQEYAATQLNTFERSAGWIFWTYKTENAPYWDWNVLVENKWVPSNVSSLPTYVYDACPSSYPPRFGN